MKYLMIYIIQDVMIIKRDFYLNQLINSKHIDSDEKIIQEQKSLLHINDAFKKIIIIKECWIITIFFILLLFRI